MDIFTLLGPRLTGGEVNEPAANGNDDTLVYADTALPELYRLRRAVLARDPSSFTVDQWRQRREALMKLDDAVTTCLSYL